MARDFNRLNPNLLYHFNDLVGGGFGLFSLILTKSPLLYYRLLEASGTEVQDASPFQNDGTSSSVGINRSQLSPTTSSSDRSYLFDGSSGFISVPTSVSLAQPLTEFTVEMWIRVDALPSFEETLIGRGAGTGLGSFQLSITPSGRIKFWIGSNEQDHLTFSESVVVPDRWAHVMAIWNGTSNVVYLDGKPGEVVANALSVQSSTDPIEIAYYKSASHFKGNIDDIAIYAQALDQSDALTRYQFAKEKNTSPTITSFSVEGQTSGALQIFEGESVSFQISAVENDPGDLLSYSVAPQSWNSQLTYQSSPTFAHVYTKPGVYTPVGFVSDSKAMRTVVGPVVEVLPQPSIQALNLTYATSYATVKILPVLDSSQVPVAGTISSVTQPLGGSVTILGSGNTAQIEYTPPTEFQGIDSFTYTLTDGLVSRSTGTIDVLVTPKLSPLVQDITFKVEGGSLDNRIQPQISGVSRPVGDILSLVSAESPTVNGGVVSVDQAANELLYTPETAFLGVDTFIYVLEDETGLRQVGEVSVEVGPLSYEALDVFLDIPYQSAVNIQVLKNDVASSPLTIQSVTQPPSGEGMVTIEGGGTYLLYDLSATTFLGSTSFTYTNTDNSNTSTATVQINTVKETPTAISESYSLLSNTSRSLNVMENDLDREGLPLGLKSFTNPALGTLLREDNGTGSDLTDDTLLYTPFSNAIGEDSFEYVIEDLEGTTSSTTVLIGVGFGLALDVDQAVGPAVHEFEFESTLTPPPSFEVNYTYFWNFGDGNTATLKSPSHVFEGIGNYTVSCTVYDTRGNTLESTLNVEVTSNTPPLAVPITVSVAEGLVLNFDPRSNDIDQDGEGIFISNVNSVSLLGGSVVVNSAGTPGTSFDDYLTYIQPVFPTPFRDSFSYQISDPYGLTSTAIVTVDVKANLAPIASNVYIPTIFEEKVIFDPTLFVIDTEDDDITIVDVDNLSAGSARVLEPELKEIEYTPATGFLGTATLDFTITDTFSNQDEATASIAVFGQFYPKRVVQDSPISFYNFNEPEIQGRIAYDVMPLLNHGRYINKIKRDGILGPLAKDLTNCAEVTQGYVRIFTNAMNITDQFTLEYWTRNSSGSTSSLLSPIISVDSNGGTFIFNFSTENNTVALRLADRELDEWYYIGMTYDGQFLSVFVDLKEVFTIPMSGNVILPTIINAGQGMAGQIAALAFYDKPLTLQDFKDHYDQAVGILERYDILTQSSVEAGSSFDVTARSRDVTGKRVLTDDSTDVTFSSDDAAIEFDGNENGTFNEP